MEIQILYNQQQTIYFPMIKAGSNDFAVAADWTPVAADANYTKDGGSWTQCSGTVAIAASGAEVWKLTLSAAETQCTRLVIAITDATTKAVEDQCLICTTQLSGQIEATKGIIIGEVDDGTFTPTSGGGTTVWEGLRLAPNLTEETTADHYNGRLILFTSGNLLGQMSDVTDYVLANSKEKFTVTEMTEAPADGDRYVVL
jgi:hypothetical protein